MNRSTITTIGDRQSLVYWNDVEPLVASDDHPNWDRLLELIDEDQDNVEAITNAFDPTPAVTAKFKAITDRVSIGGGNVMFDGDVVNSAVTTKILEALEQDAPFMPLVNFLERVQDNPNKHSRDQLFRWIERNGFTLNDDGLIVAYKGVKSDYASVHNGPGFVDGEPVSRVYSKPGTVVSISRNEVVHDPGVGCAYGLHVANWNYASRWSEKVVLVLVNPRDIVSVPTDSQDQKVRTCRYYVVRDVDAPLGKAFSSERFVAAGSVAAKVSKGEFVITPATTVTVAWNGPVDTRLNYTKQKRGPGGRFLPKGS